LEGGSVVKIEIAIPGKEPPLGKKGFDVGFKPVERNFFQTVGKHILRGRLFENQNDIGRRGVLINSAMARKFWPHEDPIGNQIQLKGKDYQIIGIVQDGLDIMNLQNPPEPFFYLPFSEWPANSGTILVETVDNPALLADAIRREVLSIDSNAKIISVETLKDDIGRVLWINRLMFLFVGALGFIGIFLTAVGLYGVISYVMQRRTKEIGVRLALGARSQDVVWLGLRHGLRVASIGAFFGLCVAVVAAIIIAHINDEMHSSPIVFIGACAFVLCVALVSSYVPSRRAAKVNPMVALRCE
jgi:ABC-type antimicrobial peptide transport system permease subunit